MISSATYPRRVFFGVLEFVKNADDSREGTIPPVWRSRVRVYAVSHKIATSLRNARRLCYDKTYSDEPYVLFVRAASMIRGWDASLVHSIRNRNDKPKTAPCGRVYGVRASARPNETCGSVRDGATPCGQVYGVRASARPNETCESVRDGAMRPSIRRARVWAESDSGVGLTPCARRCVTPLIGRLARQPRTDGDLSDSYYLSTTST